MELRLILAIVFIVSIVVNYFLFKWSLSLKKSNDNLNEAIRINNETADKITDIEIQKEEVRTEYDNKKNDILNADIVDVYGVQDDKPQHNHTSRYPCTENCPAYVKPE